MNKIVYFLLNSYTGTILKTNSMPLDTNVTLDFIQKSLENKEYYFTKGISLLELKEKDVPFLFNSALSLRIFVEVDSQYAIYDGEHL